MLSVWEAGAGYEDTEAADTWLTAGLLTGCWYPELSVEELEEETGRALSSRIGSAGGETWTWDWDWEGFLLFWLKLSRLERSPKI